MQPLVVVVLGTIKGSVLFVSARGLEKRLLSRPLPEDRV
jgi:hypothetical protein